MRADRQRSVAIEVAQGAVIITAVLDGTCRLTPDEALGLAFRLASAAEQANAKRQEVARHHRSSTD